MFNNCFTVFLFESQQTVFYRIQSSDIKRFTLFVLLTKHKIFWGPFLLTTMETMDRDRPEPLMALKRFSKPAWIS